MSVGLVVGKFAPLHKGHQLLIEAAMKNCDTLIIISYSNPALGFSPYWKKMWLEHLYPDAHVIVPSMTIPRNDAHEDLHRLYCAELCENHGFIPDMVFTSEDYGDGFADFLSTRWKKRVSHVLVDINRMVVPTSGTALRENKSLWGEYVDPFVQKNHTRRLAILGGESAGKTTLARNLSTNTGWRWIPEYGRTHCEMLGGVAKLNIGDMRFIGTVQVNMEESTLGIAKEPWLICDTTPLTTAWYSQELFGEIDPRLAEMAKRKYDAYVILTMNNGWHQDGDRMSLEFSRKQEAFYIDYLKNEKNVWVINSPYSERVPKILEKLEEINEYDSENEACDASC